MERGRHSTEGRDYINGNLRVSESNQTCLNCRAGADSRPQSGIKTENGKLSTPSPLRGTTPVSGVESVTIENTAPALLPIEGANKVLGELTQSQFVPGEGKTPQFDERTLPAGQRGSLTLNNYVRNT